MRLTAYLFFFLSVTYFSNAQTSSRWYILSLGDQPVGFYSESSISNNATTTTEVHMKLKISRLGSDNIMESRQSVSETEKSGLVQIKSQLMFSKQLNQITADIGPTSIKMTHLTGGKESISEIPNQLLIAGNEAVRLMSKTNLSKPGDSIIYNTFFPEYGLVVKGTRQYLQEERLEIMGEIVIAKKVKDTFKGLPIIRTSWLDSDGRFLKSTEPNPFGQMTLVMTDEKSALAVSNSKTELTADQYSGTIVKSNVRLPQSRDLESVTIKITHRNPELGFPKFDGTYQKVLEQTRDYTILQISSPKIGAKKEILSPEALRPYIETTSFFNKEDTLVIKTVAEITKGETDPWKKVILIRDWVNRNMRLDPGIAMAPSSEVMRNLAGTCISFATITTTLCRAAGIPTRYLAGYVYLNGAWGGHAWVDVYINQSWIPIDGAMPSPAGVSDASRFFFSRTSGVNGISECFIAGAQMYSSIDIAVLDYTLKGKTIKVDAPLYRLQNRIYTNEGLGIKLVSPKEFSFSDLDNFFPDNTILTLRHENGKSTIKLKQYFLAPRSDFDTIVKNHSKEFELNQAVNRFKGLKAIKGYGKDKAIFVVEKGLDVFVFSSEGVNAGKNLDKAIEGLTIKPTLN